MRKTVCVSVALLLCSLLGCGSEPGGPTAKQLRSTFSVEIPGYWEVVSFDIEASQNIGTEVEPVYKSRFKATVGLKSDTFVGAGKEEEAIFIKPAATSGEKRELYGISTSKLHAGAWKTDFELQNNPLPDLGQPRDFFRGEKIIVMGSPEEEAFRTETAKRREEKRKALEKEQKEKEELRTKQTASIKKSVQGEVTTFKFLAYPKVWSVPITLPDDAKFSFKTNGKTRIRVQNGVDRIVDDEPGKYTNLGEYLKAGTNLSWMSREKYPVEIVGTITLQK